MAHLMELMEHSVEPSLNIPGPFDCAFGGSFDATFDGAFDSIRFTGLGASDASIWLSDISNDTSIMEIRSNYQV